MARLVLSYERSLAGGQVERVMLMNRQPRAFATRSTAGNQLSAWLSPNSTIVVLARVLP